MSQELSHSMVHYLLTIHKLKETKGYARVTDIAKELGLTKGSVSTSLNNLKSKSLIEEEEGSKFVILSPKGHEEVHQILTSRSLLFYFSKDFVGVSKDVALRDACLMEHLLSKEAREKFFNYIKKHTCCQKGSENCDISKNELVQTSLDLCDFKNITEFIDQQKFDGYQVKKNN